MFIFQGLLFKLEVLDDDTGHGQADLMDKFVVTFKTSAAASATEAKILRVTYTGQRSTSPSRYYKLTLQGCILECNNFGDHYIEISNGSQSLKKHGIGKNTFWQVNTSKVMYFLW